MTQRNLAVDSLKVALACMVVGIHGHFLNNESPLLSGLLTNGLFRVAVPAFFILNGYYLAPALADPPAFGRWLKRILILYAVWSFVYAPQFAPPWHPLNQFGVLLATGFNHLWYLIAAAMGGCLLYIVNTRWPKAMPGLAAVLFLAGVAVQYDVGYGWLFSDSIQRLHFLTPLYRNFALFAFPYMVLGVMMARGDWLKTISRPVVLAMAVFGIILVTVEAWINLLYRATGTFDLLLLAPPAALGLCLLALRSSRTTASGYLSHLSIFVYLLHPWVLTAFDSLHWTATGATGPWPSWSVPSSRPWRSGSTGTHR